MLLIEQLKHIPDHRGIQGRKYPLWLLLFLILLGTVCGYVGYRPLADFTSKHRNTIWRLLELPENLSSPSYSTFRRTMQAVNPQDWERVFNVWAIDTLPEEQKQRLLAIDGKSIKCTSIGGNTNQQNFVSIVSVYDQSNDGVLQIQVMENKKESEITVVRELIQRLTQLSPKQCITLDALHTQRDTVKQIIQAGHDYLITVKTNQPSLYKSITDLEEQLVPTSLSQETDTSHGRLVQRKISVYDAPSAMKEKWIGLKTIAVVNREGDRKGKKFREKMYYITSQDVPANQLMGEIRGHWGIENKLHWVKDVTFSEDNPPRIGGHAPVNWAIMFTWLITLARRAKVRTVPQALRLWTNQVDEVFALLS